jgi:hypothetical protein
MKTMKTINKLNTIKRVLGENVKVGTLILDKKYDDIYEVMWHEKDARNNLMRVGVTTNLDTSPMVEFELDGEDLENEIYDEKAIGDKALRYMIYK